jgi:hypothetical protein
LRDRDLILPRSDIVPQKSVDEVIFMGYSKYMANVFNMAEPIAEGCSIRRMERIAGFPGDPIMHVEQMQEFCNATA